MPKKSNKKRADGRIAVQVYIGMVDGKRKYKTVYGKTQKEADAKADEVRIRMSKGLSVGTQDTFQKWAEFYIEMKRGTVSDARYKLLKARAGIWIDLIGKQRITSIRMAELQSALNQIAACNPQTGENSAKRTVQAYMQILNGIFDYAIDNRIIDYNPAARLTVPLGLDVSERRALTADERRIVVEFEHRGKTAMLLLMFSGLRRGEATALLWSDIDFKNHTISVSKSYDFKGGRLKSPKNGKSRIVTVPSLLTDYLSEQPRTSPLVLSNTRNGLMTEISWKGLFKSYFDELNKNYIKVEPFTPHELRHTFCTMMYEAGIDVLVAQRQMGHSSPDITLKTYTHLQEEHRQNELKKMDEIYNRNANASQMQVSGK